MKTAILFVRMTPELHAKLKALAEADRRDVSTLARFMLEDAVAARKAQRRK